MKIKHTVRGRVTCAKPSSLLSGRRPHENKRGCKRKPIVEFPEAIPESWINPPEFNEALKMHLRRHLDTAVHLHAIQDTPETVLKHYGRFLPQDKAALAAQIPNRVWEAA